MGNRIKEMILTILIIVGTIFFYHISFVKEFCRTDTKNYLVIKVKEKKCAKGFVNFITNNYETKKLSVLPPWAK
jgi:hypothetical protein